ncbi:imidazole glycerol phosphate synthase subunit HisF [Scrofimicrobium sp. R131]|uniref:Imidazole glycerol phosphate synthase subunit HisF n=1 Tax=Scrofimicrobium appendicitidis TaxID=3079930 RepID=A0AAU7V4N5_9ACTO
MVAIRVIPCLDVAGGRVVKGVNFENLRDAGDPVELASVYSAQGADEVTFLDVSASLEERGTMRETVRRTAAEVFVPLTVGGGIRTVADVEALLACGADKVSVNTSALARPELITEVAKAFGSQVLVLSVDARRVKGEFQPYRYEVTTHGGKRSAGVDALAWTHEAQERGVGEVLLNSMDADGVRTGFDLEMLSQVREVTSVPLIASGGAGEVHHFVEAAQAGADAVLAASVFHFGVVRVSDVKEALAAAGFEVRPA